MIKHVLQPGFFVQNILRTFGFFFSTEEWLTFAKFLARCRGRQQAAEEALCQAAKLMGAGKEVSKETALEVERQKSSVESWGSKSERWFWFCLSKC